MSQFILGVTGGIGAGKTAATDCFEQLGIVVVDADVVARQVVEPGKPALNNIVAEFGKDILLTTGDLNRSALRELIFSDESAKTKLNSIMHPAIRQALLTQLAEAKSKYVILSAPLLFENKLEGYADKVLVIDVPEEVQLKRASSRDDVTEAQIQAIINSQIPRKQRLEKADFVIENTGSLTELHEHVRKLHEQISFTV